MPLDPIRFVDALVTVLTTVQGIFVTVSLLSMMTSLGVQLTRGDVVRTIRESNLVVRWILANLLALPLFAVLLGAAFGLPDSILVALLLVAVAPGAPFIPQLVSIAGENAHEAIRLTAALTVVATLTVPLLVAASLALLDVGVRFSLWRFLVPLLFVLVVPLVIGGVVRDRWPEYAPAVARRLAVLSNATLLVALVIVVILDLGGAFRALTVLWGTGSILIMVLFVLASVLVGWLAGGPSPRGRRLLALGTAGRNINIAIFVATSAFPASNADDSIVAFAIIMLVVSLLVAWYWRRNPRVDASPRDEPDRSGVR